MTPAWYKKLTPFALRNLSSDGEIPSTIDGALCTSSAVKNHWFMAGRGVCLPDGCAGDCWLDDPCGCGGDVRVLCCGGVGTAGGTSRRRAGDRDALSALRGGAGTVGG